VDKKGADKKGEKKKKKDPNAPKKNLSSYMFYSNAKRAEVRIGNRQAASS
jgi:structure-specific recognition protein 1